MVPWFILKSAKKQKKDCHKIPRGGTFHETSGEGFPKSVFQNMKKRSKKSAFAQTTEDYASRSSIHGIGYVFDTSLGIVDRLFWLLVVVAFVGVVVALTWNFWSQWRNEQVMIKLGSLTAVFRWLLS